MFFMVCLGILSLLIMEMDLILILVLLEFIFLILILVLVYFSFNFSLGLLIVTFSSCEGVLGVSLLLMSNKQGLSLYSKIYL
uniref:NADH dehydrogenase subunit 4L n=1 Tax=Pyura mirabilis TaxID=111863 RepID=UPI002551DEA6|nr:NADH dehydrogenase subunit 4L [Pyura mirabilis]UPP55919.1 NADH dehydrogenase subunit 4L [Pyura mirabilis]